MAETNCSHLSSMPPSFVSIFIGDLPQPGSPRMKNNGRCCDTFITVMTFCDSPQVANCPWRQSRLEICPSHYQNHDSFHYEAEQCFRLMPDIRVAHLVEGPAVSSPSNNVSFHPHLVFLYSNTSVGSFGP